MIAGLLSVVCSLGCTDDKNADAENSNVQESTAVCNAIKKLDEMWGTALENYDENDPMYETKSCVNVLPETEKFIKLMISEGKLSSTASQDTWKETVLMAATKCQYNQTNLTYFSECGYEFPDCNNLPKIKAAFIEMSSKTDCADIISGIKSLATAASEDYTMPTEELGDHRVFLYQDIVHIKVG